MIQHCRCRDCNEVADPSAEVSTMCSGCSAAGCCDQSDTSTSGDCLKPRTTFAFSGDELALLRRCVAIALCERHKEHEALLTRKRRGESGEALDAALATMTDMMQRTAMLSRVLWRLT